VPAKFFSRVDVAKVDLHHRNPNGEQRVAQSNAGVRKTSRIKDDELHLLGRRALDPVDQFRLGVTLHRREAMTGLRRHPHKLPVNLLEGPPAVDARLAISQHVQIWTIENEDVRHLPPVDPKMAASLAPFRARWRQMRARVIY
jgi:hypothetical protein